MQQMMESLLAKMDANQAEMKADQEVLLAGMEVSQEREDSNLKEMKVEMLAKMDANQERMNANLRKEIESTVRAIEEKLEAAIHCMRAWRKETMACQEATEANPKKMEPNPEMMQSVAEHRETPTEEAAVKFLEH
jgi:flagellar hook assembly protein FlgD